MFYFSISTTACPYATYQLKFFSSIMSSLSVLLPTSRQQSYLSHNHSFSRPCNGQILVSVLLIFYFACAVGCLPPYLMVHCGCRHPLFRACLSGAASPLFRPWSDAAGGVSPPRVFPRHPLPQNGKLDEKMRRMKQKLVPLDPRASRPSGPMPPLLEIPLAPR